MEYKINTLRYYVNKREDEIKNYFKKQKKFVTGKIYNNCQILYRGVQDSYKFKRNNQNKLIKKYTLYYLVKSTKYPKESNYITTHNEIKYTGCLYEANKMKLEKEKLFRTDRLTENPYTKNYVNKDDIEIYSNYSDRAQGVSRFTCPYCNTDFKTKHKRLAEKGSTCPWCSNIMSYPERFMRAYLESKGLEYTQEHKVPKNDVRNRNYRIDFIVPELKVGIEMDGEQHHNREDKEIKIEEEVYKLENELLYRGIGYLDIISFRYESKSSKYNTLNKDIIKLLEKYARIQDRFDKHLDRTEQMTRSHKAKLKYCKENDLTLVRIDARKSNYSYIAKNIEDSILPNIIEENKKHMAYYLSLYKGKELKIGTCCGYTTKNYETKESNEGRKIDNYNKYNLPIEDYMSKCEFIKV